MDLGPRLVHERVLRVVTMQLEGRRRALEIGLQPVDDLWRAPVVRVGEMQDQRNRQLRGVEDGFGRDSIETRAGIDPATLYEVISNSAGNSWMFGNRVPHILAGDYTPLSAVDIFVKDLGIVVDSARKLTFPLPLTSSALQMFIATSAAGFGGEDDSAVIKMFERVTGIALPSPDKDAAQAATDDTSASDEHRNGT